MATTYYDIESKVAGVDPIGSGWTIGGTNQGDLTALTSEIKVKTNPVATKVWEIYIDAAVSDRWWTLGFSDGPASATMEVLALIRRNSNNSRVGPTVRAPTLNTTDRNFLWAGFINNTTGSGATEFETFNTGHLTSADHGLGNPENDWVWHRVTISGTTITLKQWLDGTDEATASYTDSWTITSTASGYGGVLLARRTSGAQTQDVAWFSIGTEGDTAPGPDDVSAGNYGVRLTGIKEPNESDTLVTDVSTATVFYWPAGDDSICPEAPVLNQSITAGAMDVALPGTDADSTPLLIAYWDAVGGETKFFRTTATIVDLDA